MEFEACKEELAELRRVLGDANKSFAEMAVQRKKRQAIIELRRAVVEISGTFSRLNRQGDYRSTSLSPVEFRFLGGDDPGGFEGYGSVFDNVDDHGDVVVRGAFADTLADHQRRGVLPGLYIEHGIYNGGDVLPAGRWVEMYEDARGLRCVGQLASLDSDYGKRVYGLVRDHALRGLSIAFSVPPGGATYTNSKTAGDPKRILRRVNLVSVDVVRSPSNPAARIDSVSAA